MLKPIVVVGIALSAGLLPICRAAGADGPAVLTILEGSATVFRGTSRLGAIEGVRVQPNDLVETGKDTYARLEYEDGVRLDLGPATRLQLNHPSEATSDRPALYLLSGWIKLSVGDSKHPNPPAFATPLFDGTDLMGVVLAHIDSRGGSLFVEQGRARIANRHSHAPLPPPLKAGDFASVAKDGHTAVDTRASKEFVEQMPRAFQDTIPSRLGRYRTREVALRDLGQFAYAEVEPWVDSELSVRRQFVRTWRSKADEPEFRMELTSNLRLHPEWGPVLFPELYAPKPVVVGPPWPLPDVPLAPETTTPQPVQPQPAPQLAPSPPTPQPATTPQL